MTLLASVLIWACSGGGEGVDEASTADSVATAAADLSPGPAALLEGFSTEPGVDVFGYYLPEPRVAVGFLVLSHLFVGGPAEFAAWEAGADSFPPIHFEFEDPSSPVRTNELGQEVHEGSWRVKPTAYRVTADSIAFAGGLLALGEIRFEGVLDGAAVAAAQAEGLAPVGPVLVGTLRIDHVDHRVAFQWYGGD